MAKKTPRGALLKKMLIIGSCLIAAQVFFIWHFGQQTNPVSIQDEIKSKVDKTPGLGSKRREQLKLQLAVSDYRINNGKLPATLDELRPKYFDSIPIDPDTGQPFKYNAEGAKFTIGEPEQPKSQAGTVTPVNMAVDQQTALIASLDTSPTDGFMYDPTGKRDPFRPFDFSPRPTVDATKSPLEQYDLGQLKVTAILAGLEQPKATVENQAGKGFIVQKGTKIGLNNGEVVEILSDRIRVLETVVDFTGARKTNTIEMFIRSKDLEKDKGKRR